MTFREKEYEGHRITRAFVDSGYRPGTKYTRPDNVIYKFCRRARDWLYAVKGHDTQDKPLKASMIDVTTMGKTLKNGLKLWHVNTDYYKTWIHGRIRSWPADQEGGWYVYENIDDDYLTQVTNEQKIVKPSGRVIWTLVKTGRANHYFDCEVYATACASSLNVHNLARKVIEASPDKPATPKPAPQPPQRRFVRERRFR